jgi:hypothetical protein
MLRAHRSEIEALRSISAREVSTEPRLGAELMTALACRAEYRARSFTAALNPF